MSGNNNHNESASSVTEAWKSQLREGGYEPPSLSLALRIKLSFLSRTWRRILRHTGLKLSDRLSVLEFGCGGGAQLVPLFANGWTCVGVDCSGEVLSRARRYVDTVIENDLLKDNRGRIQFINDDFLLFNGDASFDMTFQFGVLEHFLDAEERFQYMRKMFETLKPGGYAINFVPNGEHPYRGRQKAERLGGYDIPEIDYSAETLKEEMLRCGASSVQVLTHDLMGYKKIIGGNKIDKLVNWSTYLFLQFPLFSQLPITFRRRHAFWLIGIGKK